MQNITLLSLNIFSIFSIVPLYTINQKNQLSISSLLNSHFSRSFSNIIYSYTEFHSTLIENCAFSRMLNTPIVFDHEGNHYIEGLCDNDGARCCIGNEKEFFRGNQISGMTFSPDKFPKIRMYIFYFLTNYLLATIIAGIYR